MKYLFYIFLVILAFGCAKDNEVAIDGEMTPMFHISLEVAISNHGEDALKDLDIMTLHYPNMSDSIDSLIVANDYKLQIEFNNTLITKEKYRCRAPMQIKTKVDNNRKLVFIIPNYWERQESLIKPSADLVVNYSIESEKIFGDTEKHNLIANIKREKNVSYSLKSIKLDDNKGIIKTGSKIRTLEAELTLE